MDTGWISLAVGGGIAVLTSLINYIFAWINTRQQRKEALEDARRLRDESISDERRQYRRQLEERDVSTLLSFLSSLIDETEVIIGNLGKSYHSPQSLASEPDKAPASDPLLMLTSHAEVQALSMGSSIHDAFDDTILCFTEFRNKCQMYHKQIQNSTVDGDHKDWDTIQRDVLASQNEVLARVGQLRKYIRSYLAAGQW